MKVYSDSSLPKGVRLAVGVKDGYFLFAGSPNAIRRFQMPESGPDMEETPILRVSAAGWRNYLAEHKHEIDDGLAKLTAAPAFEIVSPNGRRSAPF